MNLFVLFLTIVGLYTGLIAILIVSPRNAAVNHAVTRPHEKEEGIDNGRHC